MTAAERRRAAGLAAAVTGLHVLGFFILLVLVVPRGFFGVGIGMTAYALGLRHAFDADHIAAIDNTTRRLMGNGRRPLSVGFSFSLGHSTIVLALALLFAVGARSLGFSALHSGIGVSGTIVSGTFLYLIGILNLGLLVGVVRAIRSGRWEDAARGPTGPMSRLTERLGRAIRAPWQMYPLGLLFGLGFDTATEIALLFLAAGAAGLPFYAIVCLPILFAAGMSLLDTLDGAFMAFAYGWALDRPVRRLYYNLTVTGLSATVALAIGTLELLSVAGVAEVDLEGVGYVVAGLFVATWALALAVWRLGRIEERWG